MATKADIETDLTLEITGNAVTPDKFVRGVRAFFALINELAKSAAGDGQPPQWIVQVKRGSNLIGVVPQPGYDPVIVQRVLATMPDGIRSLEASDEKPRGFTEAAMRSARDLAKIVGEDDEDDTNVRVWIKRDPVPMTAKTVAHVASIFQGETEDYGSVEGRLQVISERGGLHVLIAEPLYNRTIRCRVNEELMKEALNLFGQRVEAYGMIKYRRDGVPTSITVEEFVPFPDASQIPPFEKVRGILRN